MPTLIVGDLHFKQHQILPQVSGSIKDLGAKRVVFCGDLCDEWDATGELALDSLAFMADWVRGARDAGIRIDILLGNHDFAYIEGVPGAGTIGWLMRDIRERLLALEPVIATTVDDILVTHAGITHAWAREWLPGCEGARDMCLALGDLYTDPTGWDALTSAGPARGGWQLPGPLWADTSELARDPMPGLRQIVGHTPQRTCTLVSADPEIWCCDAFSLFRDKRPIGDSTMLVVENGEVKVVAGESFDQE